MGLSFLNKKTWHPGSFANIEKVWIAEQKHRELERKHIENIKKLKEERQIEELKKMQVEAGLIPASHLQRLDWIYQAPECTSNITTAEEFLLGKPLKEEKPEEKRHFTPVFQESYSNPNNEVFTKIHEDPLFVMRREEIKSRKEIEENPYKMKMMLKEIENNILKQKLEKKKDKRDKKDKKEKKNKKHSSRSRSNERKREEKSRNSKTDNKHHSSSKNREKEFFTPSMLKSKLNDNFGLIDKDGNKIKISINKDLGPDMSIYSERKTLIEKEDQYKKRNSSKSEFSLKNLTESEKEKIRQDMEKKARMLDNEKLIKMNENKNKDVENCSSNSRPGFIRKMQKDVYDNATENRSSKIIKK
jgi:hypothetical protein